MRRSLCLSRALRPSLCGSRNIQQLGCLPSLLSFPSPSLTICSFCPPPLLSFFHVRGGGNRPSHIMTTCWAVGRFGREQRDGTKAAAVEGRERESIIPSFVKTRQCDEAAAARSIYLDTQFCPLVNITFLIKVATNDNTLQQFSNFYANLYSEHHIERIWRFSSCSLLGKLSKRSGIIPVIRGPDFLSREANNGAISKILFQKLLQSNESMRVLPRQEKGGIPGAEYSCWGIRLASPLSGKCNCSYRDVVYLNSQRQVTDVS